MQAYEGEEYEGEYPEGQGLPDYRVSGVEPVEEFDYEDEDAYTDDYVEEYGEEELEDGERRQYSAPVPDVVKQFITYFERHIKDKNVFDIHSMYETSWNKITEKYYKNSPWPTSDVIAPLVNFDETFLLLYRELYYRHVYARMQPTLEQRFESWKNYCNLFNFLLNANIDLDLELPKQWLWDIINEFIYQFQSFCLFRSKLKNKPHEEVTLLNNNQQVWNVSAVINYLESLVAKSNVVQLAERQRSGAEAAATNETAGFAAHSLFRQLGHFSVVGLVRLHVLVGDYYLAAKVLSPFELYTKGAFSQVTGCHITLYYHIGFVYMMMRRYVDAIRAFSHILQSINRAKQYQNRTYQLDQIIKKGEQMYALLAICVSVCPQRVEENVHTALREKYGDKMQKIQKGEENVIEELFVFGCPKFVNPCPPNYVAFLEGASNTNFNFNSETAKVQTKLFLNEIKQQALIPTIRSYLKLYSTIEVQKLANFLDLNEKAFRTQLMCYKHKSRTTVNNGGAPLGGELTSSSDIDFFVDKDMVHIIDNKTQRRYSEFFIRHINKFDEIIVDLEKRS